MEQDGLSGSLSDVGGMKPLHPVGLRPTCLHPPQCNRLAIRSLALSGCPPNLGGSNANVCSLVGAERRVRSPGCCPQHRVNGSLGARRRVRGHFIVRGGAGIRGAGSLRQSDRRRLQGPQRHDFTD